MARDAVDLSIVIPAYNEAERLPATLRSLRAFLEERRWRAELVLADDGSTDQTVAAAVAAAGTLPLHIVALGVNQGKGAAVRRGIAEALGARIGFVDADLPYALSGVDLAMERLASGADLVIGGRDLPGASEVRGYGLRRRLSGKVYSVLVNALAVRDIPDTQCGFKWFRAAVAREIFPRLTVPGYAFDVEVLLIAQLWGLRIDRIPVQFTHSDASRLRLVRDSARMFRDLLAVNRRRARGVYDRRSARGAEAV